VRSREQRQMDRLAARAPRVHVGPQASINVMNKDLVTMNDGVWRWTDDGCFVRIA
jgi:hypothetical protein